MYGVSAEEIVCTPSDANKTKTKQKHLENYEIVGPTARDSIRLPWTSDSSGRPKSGPTTWNRPIPTYRRVAAKGICTAIPIRRSIFISIPGRSMSASNMAMVVEDMAGVITTTESFCIRCQLSMVAEPWLLLPPAEPCVPAPIWSS